jgi:CheY-like chemotaxis protein
MHASVRSRATPRRGGPSEALRHQDASKPSMSTVEQNSHCRNRRPLVLVVDDYQDGREMCAEYLSICGFGVAQAANGFEALEKATALHPDLILMDLSLPGLDGWEVTKRLKRDARTSTIPVIALTARALCGDADRARQAGCDAFMTKPCLPDALVEEVRRMLESAPGQRV